MTDEPEEATRLSTRPHPPTDVAEPGLYQLELGVGRDGALYIPEADGDRPLMVVFHGATMSAHQMVRPLLAAADDAGVVLLVPDSRGQSWDIICNRRYGPDVEFLDGGLELAFSRCRVDPARVSVGGVSDGASYALSIGVGNGDLFSKIVAWSPGFIMPMEVIGKPKVFVSHGIHDRILPIDMCGRNIVAGLRQAEYDVDYREFDGGHEMPDPLIRAAFDFVSS